MTWQGMGAGGYTQCGMSDKPHFDEELAKTYIGKHLLIGITYLDPQGRMIDQKQMHGVIVRIGEEEGVVVLLHGSDRECAFPPDLSSYHPLPPGEYRLRMTGEVIVNPDLGCDWYSDGQLPEIDPMGN